MKVLLVDDDDFALKLLEMQLRQQGCADIVVHNRARDALLALQAQPGAFDLLFCDLRMPDVDGVEFVRHLARIDFQGGLALVSGSDVRVLQSVFSLARSHGIRVLGAFHKPVAPEQLVQVLEQAASAPRPGVPKPRPELPAEELRTALESGALLNHYQPQLAMADGALVGVEALVRWQHPRLGLVYPDQFVAVAERHRLIDALTHAVAGAAMAQSMHWRQHGLAIPVAINVSMDSLRHLDLPDRIAEAAAEAGVPARDLVFEVTESRLMTDPLAVLDILTRLRLKGFGLAIDDFGTGHSSLAQLRDLPFTELKLDRSFVSGADHDRARRAIVEATLAMAHQLGMKVVAEGVETRAEWDLLAALGCDVAQGYLIARPMAADVLLPWHEAVRTGAGGHAA